MRNSQKLFAYSLLLPAFLVVGSFLAYPLYLILRLSFHEQEGMNLASLGEWSFTFQHYISILSDSATWNSLWVSIVYTFLSTLFAFLIGLGTALLLNRKFTARRWLRMFILLPWSVPGVVAVLSFVWILDASYGVFNYLLKSIGVINENIAWFSDPDTAMIAVIIPTVWKGYPFFTLMLLAALQSIPGDLYEAAKIDGANRWGEFRYITLPGIQTTAVLSIVLNGLWVFREFDFIYPTTGGGPSGATETLAIRIYDQAFSFFQMGTASALGVLTTLICVVAILGALPLLKGEFFGGPK